MSSEAELPKVVEMEYLHLQVEPELSLICLTWKRQVNLSELRTGFYTAVEVARNFGCKYWLGDARKTSMLDIADNDFLVEHLVGQLSESGIEKVARVVSEEEAVLSQSYTMKNKIESTHQDQINFNTDIFTTLEAARKFLFS
jgi:hypothetical protein